MLQRFYEDNIQSRFIKALLYNTPIPTIQSIVPGDYIIKGAQYIYKRQVIKCTTSGIIGQEGKYEILGTYTIGEYVPKYTYKYLSTTDFYDSKTHEMLGKYLRLYRDQTNIDLLPFYNCFSNNYNSGIRVRDGEVITTKSTAYKCALIPISLNRKYTIAFDCVSNVWFAPVFLHHDQFVNFSVDDQNYDLTKMITDPTYSSVVSQTSMSFTQPYLYSLNLDIIPEDRLQLFKQYEDYLYLLIQLPMNNSSSITVLEGDYTELRTKKQYNPEYVENLSDAQLNSLLLSKLSLLQFNDEQQLPYSPRLFEYLLQNVITKEDVFWKDVTNIQDYLNFPSTFKKMKGVWDKTIRSKLYSISTSNSECRKVDLNGYVDKDVEKIYDESGVV